MQELLDFDVAIEPIGDGYRTRVISSPAGEAYTDFALPFTDENLTILILRVIGSIGRARRKVRRIQSEERRLLEDFGGQLFQAVFSGSVRECLGRSRLIAENRDAGLRIRLRLPGALADIPWEYLHDPGYGFLGLSPETPLIRYLEMPAPVRPFSISPPLRILAMISAPTDAPGLESEEEWGKLTGALDDLIQSGLVEVDRLEAGTLAALQRPLRRREYHVLHFIGHGNYDEDAQDGALVLEGADRKTRLVTGRDLGLMIRGHRSLRLVVLNACEGARSARDDPFGGVAQALVRQGIPAVIAMQFEISDPAALVFSQSFYQAIADGLPVDVATLEARRAMFADGNEVEWATPVLYLRSPDGRVFTRAREEAERQPHEQADRLAELDAAASAAEGLDTQALQRLGAEPETSRGEYRQLSTDAATPEAAAAQGAPRPIRILTGHKGWRNKLVTDVVFSPDGRLLASGGSDKTVRLWDSATGQEMRTLIGHTSSVKSVAFSPDGQLLASGDSGLVRLWDPATGQLLRTLPTDGSDAVAFSPDGQLLASGGDEKTVRLWDPATGLELRTLIGHTSSVKSVAFSPDGQLLASGGDEKTVRLWDPATGLELRTLIGHTSSVKSVAFSPDGQLLASGGSTDWTVQLWDPATGLELRTLTRRTGLVNSAGGVNSVAFSPDGQLLASGGLGRTVRLWDPASGQELRSLIGHTRFVNSVAFSPDGRLLAISGDDKTVWLWDFTPVDR